MKAEEKIRELIRKSDMPTGPEAEERILGDAVAHLSQLKQQRAAKTWPSIWRIIMENKTISFTAAAVIIIACVVGVSLWRSTGSGIALADVLARVEQVKAFRCKMSLTMYNPGKPDRFEQHGTVVMSRDYGYKGTIEVRDPNGKSVALGKRYFYPKKKTIIQIGHPIKTYFRWEVDDSEAQWNQEFLSQYSDPGALLRDIMSCQYEILGRSTVDGVEVEGFRTTDPNCRSSFSKSLFNDPQAKLDVKVWVNAKTRLPVQCEDLASGLGEMGNPAIIQSITTDYEWDIPVTAAEFDPPPVPDGYAVVNARPEPSDEEAAIQGLRQCVALFGDYLETIGDGADATELILLAIEKSETPAALRLKKRVEGLTEDKRLDTIKSDGIPLRRLIWFYVRLVQDKKDPAYYGKTVTPKDADKVLLRWKLSENKYRVIFGDLRGETVSPEKLAELENPARQPAVRGTPTAEQETSPAGKYGNIIWVSDAVDVTGDGIPDDQAWVDMLKARGYTVDYTKGAAPKEGYWRTLDNDKIAALNAADLIIVSRCIGPVPPYVRDGESTKWNSVKTPMILMHTYFARRRSWSWLDTHTPPIALWPGSPPSHSAVDALVTLAPNHPIFKDVQLDSKNQVKIFDQTVGSGKVSFNAIADVGNGTLIAKPSDQDWTFIAEWEPGSEFYPGAGQTPGGRRMIFAAGTIEWAAGGCGRGEYNLNAQGEKLFINMIEYMLGNLEKESDVKKTPTSEQEPEITKSLPYADAARSLHYAARDGDLVQVKLLVSKGADINTMDDRLAGTPLHLAAYYAHSDVVQFLISNGANINARNKWNRTALDEAVDQGHSEIAEVLRKHGAKLGPSIGAGKIVPSKSLLESAASKFTIPEKNLKISEQMQSCAANMRKIYAAIKEYEKDKGTLPIWLSDLVPDYMSKEMLLCPHKPDVTGRKRHDPRFPCSYGYEFRMDRRPGMGLAGGVILRDWKIEQVELFGDVVALVRCYSHGRTINLSISGKIYLSSITWETIFIPRYHQEYQAELMKLLEKSSH